MKLYLKRARFFFKTYMLARYGVRRSLWYTLDMVTRTADIRFWWRWQARKRRALGE